MSSTLPKPPPSIPPALRILVRGVNWLGDAVMTTPALLRLREAHPLAHISLLTHQKLAALWNSHPALDSVLTFDEADHALSVGLRLRSFRFDVAVLLPNSPRVALESFIAGIPRRIGYRRPWRNWFLTECVAPRTGEVPMRKRSAHEIAQLVASAPATRVLPANAHHLFQYLPLAAALGACSEPLAPQIAVSDDEVNALKKRFGFPSGRGKRPRLFALNPGAAYGPAKCWPADRFIAAARAVQERIGCHWWILGGPGEAEQATAIAREIQAAQFEPPESVQCLAGRTSLRELCAVLKACDLVLTNDSGPMHLAAAVGTPVVALFGSTSPELTGPGLPGDARHMVLRANAACSPCFLRRCPIDFRCMTGIRVEQVVEAVLSVARRD